MKYIIYIRCVCVCTEKERQRRRGDKRENTTILILLKEGKS